MAHATASPEEPATPGSPSSSSGGTKTTPKGGDGSVRLGAAPPAPPDAGAGTRGAGAGSGTSDDGLPRLPIPPLEDTIRRFVASTSAICEGAEQEEVRAAADEFLAADGSGRALDAALREYDATPESEGGAGKSYLERFWYEGYLKPRSPLPINSNPFFVLEDDPTPSRNSQTERATSLIYSSLKFASAVRRGTLEPDMFKKRPLCMSQYAQLFGAARIPGIGKDTHVVHDSSTHIVVLCRSQFYWFEVFTPEGKLCISQEDIATNLRIIRHDASSASAETAVGGGVGVLTSLGRDDWARTRQSLAAVDDANRDSLHVVDSALFLVCLDDVSPGSLSESSENCLHGTTALDADGTQVGTCTNRWYDKSLQIIVSENGSAGINFEHSYLDGHTVLRFASDVFTDTILRFAATIRGTLAIADTLPPIPESFGEVDASPRKIVWKLTPDIQHAIRRAESRISDLISQTEILAYEFGGFGKKFIVSHNLSPDALVQLSYQLAYFTLYGELRNTYETVMTKNFDHGRTESARSATSEALAFVHAFTSAAGPQAKVEALRRAVRAQVDLVRACTKGHGADRHLMAMRLLAEERGLETPRLFETKAYKDVCSNTISTSNCGNPSLRLFGFGPVAADGFGVGYIIKNDGIQFCTSSWRRQTGRFLFTLQQSLEAIRRLLDTTSEKKSPSTSSFPLGSVPLASMMSTPGGGAPMGAPAPRSSRTSSIGGGSDSRPPHTRGSVALAGGGSSSAGPPLLSRGHSMRRADSILPGGSVRS